MYLPSWNEGNTPQGSISDAGKKHHAAVLADQSIPALEFMSCTNLRALNLHPDEPLPPDPERVSQQSQ